MRKKEPYIGIPLTRHPQMSKAHRVDPTAAREHLAFLHSIGMTDSMVARAAGLSTAPFTYLRHHPQQSLLAPTSRAILSVTPRPHRQQALVLGYGLHRRMGGLAVMGWPIRRIADEAGLDFETLSRARRSVRVQLRTHELIAAAYERLEHIDFGDTRTKKWAQQQGFTHPAYWDDIDDYFEIPAVPADSGAVDEIVVRRLVNGQPVPGATQAERLEAVRILTLRGRSADEIAAALRVSGRTVERDRKALAC